MWFEGYAFGGEAFGVLRCRLNTSNPKAIMLRKFACFKMPTREYFRMWGMVFRFREKASGRHSLAQLRQKTSQISARVPQLAAPVFSRLCASFPDYLVIVRCVISQNRIQLGDRDAPPLDRLAV